MPDLSCGPPWLDVLLDDGELLLLDGAMGTELEARGVPMHKKAWSGSAMLEHGDTVRQLHADYIQAGARVVTANTFSTGRHMLEPAGLGGEVAEVNRRAVELAREARDAAAAEPVAIAGSICEWVFDGESRFIGGAALMESLKEQAMLLAEAGVDLIALEMCERLPESDMALEAARATGLPVWVGVSCRRAADKEKLQTFDQDTHGEFEPLVEGLTGKGAAVFNVMHSPVPDTTEGLEIVRRHWKGPLGAYPESGYFVMPNWQFVEIIPPEDLVAVAREWIDSGVQIIGGCCGLGPGHIRALKEALVSTR